MRYGNMAREGKGEREEMLGRREGEEKEQWSTRPMNS